MYTTTTSSDLDVTGVAHDCGIVRLPKMRELCDRDLTAFARVDKQTVDIPYKDKNKEKKRQVDSGLVSWVTFCRKC